MCKSLNPVKCYGGETLAVDPICRMSVDEKTAKWKSEFRGNAYYFCAPGCKATFDKSPEKYIGGGVHHH